MVTCTSTWTTKHEQICFPNSAKYRQHGIAIRWEYQNRVRINLFRTGMGKQMYIFFCWTYLSNKEQTDNSIQWLLGQVRVPWGRFCTPGVLVLTVSVRCFCCVVPCCCLSLLSLFVLWFACCMVACFGSVWMSGWLGGRLSGRGLFVQFTTRAFRRLL